MMKRAAIKDMAAGLLEQIYGKKEQTVDQLQPERIVGSTRVRKKGGKQQ